MLTSTLLALALTGCSSLPVGDQPAELGTVRWERDFEAATERAAKSERPLLLLFQEVPG